MDVKFYEVFSDEQEALARFLPEYVTAEYVEDAIQESGDKAPPAPLISIRTQSQIPGDWKGRLGGILTRSHGYDHLTKYRRETNADLAMGYLENYCARAVAEQAAMSAMALLRKFKKQIAQFETFHREGLTGLECKGRNVLVAGVGNIGEEIVAIARGLEMNVKGFDADQRISDLSYVSLQEGIAWADIVFCALSLNAETEGMINQNVLGSAKPGLILINIARGEITPVKDLKKLIDNGVLGGLALDVYPDEANLGCNLRNGGGLSKDEQIIADLAKQGNVLFTPHNAFNSKEALELKASFSAGAITYFLKHGSFPMPVPAT